MPSKEQRITVTDDPIRDLLQKADVCAVIGHRVGPWVETGLPEDALGFYRYRTCANCWLMTGETRPIYVEMAPNHI